MPGASNLWIERNRGTRARTVCVCSEYAVRMQRVRSAYSTYEACYSAPMDETTGETDVARLGRGEITARTADGTGAAYTGLDDLRAEVEALEAASPPPEATKELRERRRKAKARLRAREYNMDRCGTCNTSGPVESSCEGQDWPCPNCGRWARPARLAVHEGITNVLVWAGNEADAREVSWWRRAVAYEGGDRSVTAFERVLAGKGQPFDGSIGKLAGRATMWAALVCDPRLVYEPAASVGDHGHWMLVERLRDDPGGSDVDVAAARARLEEAYGG